MKNLTKKAAEKYYKSEFFNPSDTWTDKRCKWNDFVEGLRRNGEISEKQAQTWGQPKFVNPPNERKPKGKTLEWLVKNTTQLTGENILSGRFHHVKKGWINTNLSPEEKNKAIEMIAATIGGNKPNQILNALKWAKPHHWAVQRMIFAKRKDGKIYCSYCAGQDMSWEMRELRKYLYNL